MTSQRVFRDINNVRKNMLLEMARRWLNDFDESDIFDIIQQIARYITLIHCEIKASEYYKWIDYIYYIYLKELDNKNVSFIISFDSEEDRDHWLQWILDTIRYRKYHGDRTDLRQWIIHLSSLTPKYLGEYFPPPTWPYWLASLIGCLIEENKKKFDRLSSEELLTNDLVQDCPICLQFDPVFSRYDCRWKTKCGHTFHHKCISKWVKHCDEDDKIITCPVCRTDIVSIHLSTM